MTEKEKYLQRIDSLKDLKYISFTTGHIKGETITATEEEVYAELNRMLEAPDMPDEEVLGKYSLCLN